MKLKTNKAEDSFVVTRKTPKHALVFDLDKHIDFIIYTKPESVYGFLFVAMSRTQYA